MNKNKLLALARFTLAVGSMCLLAACEKKDTPLDTSASTNTSASTENAATKEAETLTAQIPQLSKRLFDSGDNSIGQIQQSAKTLDQAINAFLQAPSESTLNEAQAAWVNARIDYRHFYFYREIALVEPSIFANLNRLDYQIAAYPIQPGFLDAFGAYTYSGLIHDIGFPLNKESLTNQHGITDLSDVALGFHAIEFFLFGHGDETRKPAAFFKATTLDAEHKERGFEKLEEIPNNRRRTLLALQADLLIDDLHKLKARWRNTEEDSTEKSWLQTDKALLLSIGTKAIESALTKIMIEISEINKGELDTQNVSPSIIKSTQQNKQDYIRHALKTIEQNLGFISNNKKAAIQTEIKRAIALTEQDVFDKGQTQERETNKEEGKTEQEYWREVFAHLKQAADTLIHH